MTELNVLHSRALVALRSIADQHGPTVAPGELNSPQRQAFDDKLALSRLAGAAASRNALQDLDMARAEQALARWSPDAVAARALAGTAFKLLEQSGLEGPALERARGELASVAGRIGGGVVPMVVRSPSPVVHAAEQLAVVESGFLHVETPAGGILYFQLVQVFEGTSRRRLKPQHLAASHCC